MCIGLDFSSSKKNSMNVTRSIDHSHTHEVEPAFYHEAKGKPQWETTMNKELDVWLVIILGMWLNYQKAKNQ